MSKLFASISNDVDELRSSCKNTLPADFGPIQKRPFLRDASNRFLPLDAAFLFEKMGRSFYWTLHEMYSRQESDKLLRFWGEVFHSYCDWVMESGYQGKGRYISDPRLGRSDDQIGDAALIEGDALLLFEYKASTVTSAAKYSFDEHELDAELRLKFVDKKGVGQLAANIRKLIADRAAKDFTLRGIERIYPVLVTLDPIVQAPGIRKYLNQRFRESFALASRHEIVTPLFAMHVGDLEGLLPYTHSMTFHNVLREFSKHGPESKHRFGSIRGNLHTFLRGIKKGRDVIGERIERSRSEFATIFPSMPKATFTD